MEEIIIDGVNVAGCEFYEPKAQVMTCHEESITKRCDKTNCYYKQLKRLEFELKVTKADYEASEQENAELKAYKDVNEDFKTAWGKLKAENERLKTKTFKIESRQTFMGVQNKELIEDNLNFSKENEHLKALCDTYRTCYQAKHSDIKGMLFKYRQTLQEIKAIAEAPKPFIDFSVIKTATEVGYDYATICNELELRLHKVLELITKAEEE